MSTPEHFLRINRSLLTRRNFHFYRSHCRAKTKENPKIGWNRGEFMAKIGEFSKINWIIIRWNGQWTFVGSNGVRCVLINAKAHYELWMRAKIAEFVENESIEVTTRRIRTEQQRRAGQHIHIYRAACECTQTRNRERERERKKKKFGIRRNIECRAQMKWNNTKCMWVSEWVCVLLAGLPAVSLLRAVRSWLVWGGMNITIVAIAVVVVVVVVGECGNKGYMQARDNQLAETRQTDT